MRELWRGEASATEAGPFGLTLPAILAKTCEALDALAAELGLGSFESTRATSALLIRQVRVRRLGAAAPGASLVVAGGVQRFEQTSLLARFELRQGDVPAADAAVLAEHIETEHAKVFPWTSRTVKAAEALRTAPTGDADDTLLTRSGARLGEPTGQGVFQAGEADAFGRIRAASLLQRALESGSWPFAAPSEAGSVQPIRNEARLRILSHPAPGDRYVAMSDVVEVDGGRWRETRVLWAPSGDAVWAQLELACGWVDPSGKPADPPADAAKALLEAAKPAGKPKARA